MPCLQDFDVHNHFSDASTHSESKIDAIETNLENIETTLRELATTTRQLAGWARESKSFPPVQNASTSASPFHGQFSDGHQFEGSSSLSAHASYANDHLQGALFNSEPQRHDLDLTAALSSLNQIVSKLSTFPRHQESSSFGMQFKDSYDHHKPPAEIVSRVLHDMRDTYDSTIATFSPVRQYEGVVSLCKDLYFVGDDLPRASRIVAYGNLYYLFRCFYLNFAMDDSRRVEFQSYCKAFGQNMMDLLGQLNLHIAPDHANVEALLLGVRLLTTHFTTFD